MPKVQGVSSHRSAGRITLEGSFPDFLRPGDTPRGPCKWTWQDLVLLLLDQYRYLQVAARRDTSVVVRDLPLPDQREASSSLGGSAHQPEVLLLCSVHCFPPVLLGCSESTLHPPWHFKVGSVQSGFSDKEYQA